LDTTEGSVSTFCLRGLLDYLDTQGIDPAELYDAETIAEIKNLGTIRTPISQCQHMIERAIDYTEDLDFPLKLVEEINPKYLGMFGFAAMSSHSLGDVIAILLQYQPLVADNNITNLVNHGDYVELHWIAHRGPAIPCFMQMALVSWVAIAKELTACHSLICDAYFSFTQPVDLSVYRRIFGGKLYFDAEVTKLVFESHILKLPIRFSDPVTHDVLMAQVNKTMHALIEPDILKQLRTYLRSNLNSNHLGIKDTAVAFGMSIRTLQYHLERDNWGYREFLDQVRHDQALHYLRTTDLSLSEIASLVGYSEQSPFQNAFKRWTGKSPGEFRKSIGKS
jgi:AraC-like DNA-binding protein